MTTRKDATREELLQAIDTLRDALEGYLERGHELLLQGEKDVYDHLNGNRAIDATDALKKE
jgi:hypothetical protein